MVQFTRYGEVHPCRYVMQDFMKCMDSADKTAVCAPKAHDYYDCLHNTNQMQRRKKIFEVAETKVQNLEKHH